MEKKIYSSKKEVLDLLSSKKIDFKEYKHKKAMTMNDLLEDPGKLEKSPFLKNLVFKDKKK